MKQAEKIYMISDAAKQVKVEAHVLRYVLEQFGNYFFLLQLREYQTTISRGIFFCFCKQRLNINAKCLCLSSSRRDALMHDKRASHVGKHCSTMLRSTAKVIEFLIVSHCFLK